VCIAGRNEDKMQTSEYRHMSKLEKKAAARHPTRAAANRITEDMCRYLSIKRARGIG
jgi:hypothetical protein